jgi:hypothetical protein
MSTKHTPGPWRVGDNGATVFGPKTDAPSPRTIATVTKLPMIIQETKANARLIAAAPEMLKALYQALARLEAAGLEDTTTDIIKAAIHSAVGESK